MGAEKRARQQRKLAREKRREMEAVILAARAIGGDEIQAVAEYLSRQTGVSVETCAREVKAWLQPHLSPQSPSSAPAL